MSTLPQLLHSQIRKIETVGSWCPCTTEALICVTLDVAFEDTANGAGGHGSDSRIGLIAHSVANGSPPLRRFFGAVISRRSAAEMNPAARYSLRRNNARIVSSV